MKDIYDLLLDIKDRYYMYTGRYDIFGLYSFLHGYCYARRQSEIEELEQEKDFRKFHGWLQEKFGLKTNNSWASIIMFISIDEKRDVETFYRLLEEFINRDKSSEIENAEDINKTD